MEDYPHYICEPCGKKYGTTQRSVSTWHYGVCEHCGNGGVPVTEAWDFGYPKFPKEVTEDGN